MSVAESFGLATSSPLMEIAREAWRRWRRADPAIAVVTELDDLPHWTLTATAAEKRDLFARLAALTSTDHDAATVLAWLLLPGASDLAAALGDLAEDIDALVAGQLWIECAEAHRLNPAVVKPEILRRTRRAVCAELGVGEGARRQDRVWASALSVDFIENVITDVFVPEMEEDGFALVTELAIDAMDAGVVTVFDAWLVEHLARVASWHGAAGGRGRMGLTTPAVVDEVAELVRLSSRALRRRATTIVDRLAEYARVRDDPDLYPKWRARHPPMQVSASEEMHLVVGDDSAEWIKARDLDPASVRGVGSGSPIRRNA